jgi:hypothetical protein
MSILDEAKNLVHNDRRKDYDHPSIFFAKYASFLSSLLASKLTAPITAEEANLAMILFKIVREHSKHKDDNIIDIAGYAETLAMIHERKALDMEEKTEVIPSPETNQNQ